MCQMLDEFLRRLPCELVAVAMDVAKGNALSPISRGNFLDRVLGKSRNSDYLKVFCYTKSIICALTSKNSNISMSEPCG